MAKRKITVTVDEDLVEAVHTLGVESLSAVVNTALVMELERRSRAAALDRLLEDWDRRYGAIPPRAAAAAATAFDDLDASADAPAASTTARARGRNRRSGVA